VKLRLLDQGAGTLFAQVFALVLVAMIGSQAINLLIVFNLPPPTPNFYTESEVVQALRGTPSTTRNGPPLLVHLERTPPSIDSDAHAGFGRFRALLASDIGIRPDDIMVITEGGPPDRRGYRLVRDRLNEQGQPHEESFLISPFKLALRMPDGRWATVHPGRRGLFAPWQQRLVLWFAVSAVALVPLAYFFARGLVKPLASFAEAAERFGRDPRAPPLDLKGSSEIVKAVTAFNEMQDRLRRCQRQRDAEGGDRRRLPGATPAADQPVGKRRQIRGARAGPPVGHQPPGRDRHRRRRPGRADPRVEQGVRPLLPA
jgi:two-component system OmpR family sensor kinase